MATECFRVDSISRGSRRTRPDGTVRVIDTRLGGSMAKRIEYVERGGSLASRADEVLWVGHAGPMVDWQAVDRRETRKDAQVGFEITATAPHTLPLAAKQRIGQHVAEHLSALFGVPVHAALHTASREGDERNEHFHFPFPARDLAGKKLTKLQKKTTSSKIVANLRGYYQDLVNSELVAAGINDRLDLRSRAARGLSEACQRINKAEFLAARRGEIVSKKYEHNQSILARRDETAALTALADTGPQLATARAALARADLIRATNAGIFHAGVAILSSAISRRGRDGTAFRQAVGRPATVRAGGPRTGWMENQKPGLPGNTSADRDVDLAGGDDAPVRDLLGRQASTLPSLAPGALELPVERVTSEEFAPAAIAAAAMAKPRTDGGERPGERSAEGSVATTSGSTFAGSRGADERGPSAGSSGRGEGGRGSDAPDPSTETRPTGSRGNARGLTREDRGAVADDAGGVITLTQAQEGPTATPLPTPPKRSMLEWLGRWLSGADRREAQEAAAAQAQADAERAAEQQRQEQEARVKAAPQERIRAEFRRMVATVENSIQPLVCFKLLPDDGQRRFAKREDWLGALKSEGPLDTLDLPICDSQGEPLADEAGEAQTVAWSEHDWRSLYPAFISRPVRVEDYTLDPEQDHAQKRGPRHGM